MRKRVNLPFFLLLVVFTVSAAHAATVKLQWEPSPDEKVKGYKVYYGTESEKYSRNVKIAGRQNTSVDIDGLDEGKIYYFAIAAYDTQGKESPRSAEVAGIPGKAGTGGKPSVPPKGQAKPTAHKTESPSAPQGEAGRDGTAGTAADAAPGSPGGSKISPSKNVSPRTRSDSKIPASRERKGPPLGN